MSGHRWQLLPYRESRKHGAIEVHSKYVHHLAGASVTCKYDAACQPGNAASFPGPVSRKSAAPRLLTNH